MNKAASLNPNLKRIIQDKGTEYPFTGEYESLDQTGTYLCRQCGLALFRAGDKFHSGCGWPSFDQALQNALAELMDADGRRTEILCSRCQAHLGHVFYGENFTGKNTRHCVNSASLDFVEDTNVIDTEEAIFAAGCFWGVEYYFKQLLGVLKTEVGYSGGHLNEPNYQAICNGHSGHFEVIRVIFDPRQINFEKLTQYFFEIHDPTQLDGQGPDLGEQYLSVAFYYNEGQRQVIEKLIAELKTQGYQVATQIKPVAVFWSAEAYHQDYYGKTGKQPYCHRFVKKF